LFKIGIILVLSQWLFKVLGVEKQKAAGLSRGKLPSFFQGGEF
jgi:hypothetical protein